MAFMDRARRVGGLLWVVVGLGFQLVLLVVGRVTPGAVTWLLVGVVIALAVVTLIRSDWGIWLVGWTAAVLLGLDFAGAVADRFGLFGPPGAAGVSWGTWTAFVDYTAQLLPGPIRFLASGAAAAATVTEVGLSGLLFSGWQRRWVGKAAAGLLLVYLVAMGGALGAETVAAYGLPILVGGALLISSAPPGRPVRAQPPDVRHRQPAPKAVAS